MTWENLGEEIGEHFDELSWRRDELELVTAVWAGQRVHRDLHCRYHGHDLAPGLTWQRVHRRVSAGWDIVKAISRPPRHVPRVSSILKVCRSTYDDRRRRGWDVDRAATEPTNVSKINFDKARAVQNGIPGRTYLHRLSRGWTVEDASTIPPFKAHTRKALRR